MNEAQLDRSLARCVYDCFITDIEALKPGNVSRYADGHGMQYADFVKSAELSTPVLCKRELPVGHRISASVKAVIEEVGCNTNLGLLLLF
ncbi:MAG: triphosphoribosyl-dephospho-CoA synthase, partial [Gammaproteobacteria bacterium]|nr:triphosphoribosyl-dephospho-CoA synthase [Gammaproteobacteria bacterium]